VRGSIHSFQVSTRVDPLEVRQDLVTCIEYIGVVSVYIQYNCVYYCYTYLLTSKRDKRVRSSTVAVTSPTLCVCTFTRWSHALALGISGVSVSV
jgi:hypothetical protein